MIRKNLFLSLTPVALTLAMFCPSSFGSSEPNGMSASAEPSSIDRASISKKKEKPAKAERHIRSIRVGKIRRSYVVNVPQGYGDKPAPVVFVLHGALGNSFTVAWDTRMTERAGKDGFIVVYPRGIGIANALKTWNAGSCCGLAQLRNVDDIAFLKALIKQLRTDYNIDGDRIYMAGASNGGMMAYRAAIEMSDQVAAIATASGTMMTSRITDGEPVSVIAFHGTKDHVVPYDGGPGGLPFWKIEGSKVADNVKFWVSRDKCSTDAVREEVGNCIKESYSKGVNGTEVCVYTVKRGKHNWPGGRSTFIRNDPEMGKIDATDIICKFFLAHPKVHKHLTEEHISQE